MGLSATAHHRCTPLQGATDTLPVHNDAVNPLAQEQHSLRPQFQHSASACNFLQGAADADNPLVQQLHSLLSANKAEAARHAFEAALAPLEAQLKQVRRVHHLPLLLPLRCHCAVAAAAALPLLVLPLPLLLLPPLSTPTT